MKISQSPLNQLSANTADPALTESKEGKAAKAPRPDVNKVDSRITPEMRKAAEGLEAVFTQQMMKAMRDTVEPSEFSLHNSASDVYQGMLDQEYSDIAARQNSLGLSEQILDYWLRDKQGPQYNQMKGASPHHSNHPIQGSKTVAKNMGTGGTHEDQSNK